MANFTGEVDADNRFVVLSQEDWENRDNEIHLSFEQVPAIIEWLSMAIEGRKNA